MSLSTLHALPLSDQSKLFTASFSVSHRDNDITLADFKMKMGGLEL